MFDQMTSPHDDAAEAAFALAPTASDWRKALRHGDIVSFRFPINENGEPDEPKLRPCLVLDIETLGGVRFASLAYGTSVPSAEVRRYDIRVDLEQSVVELGLDRPTRFIGARRILVPLDNSGFEAPKGRDTPVLGRLVRGRFARMNVVRARIQAEADIAADRREERARREAARLAEAADNGPIRRPVLAPVRSIRATKKQAAQ